MDAFRKQARTIIYLLVSAFMMLQMAPLQAAMVGTDTLIEQAQYEYDREQLQQLLERDDVQQQLVELGVDPQQARERVAAMNDAELQQLNGQMQDLPAGSSAIGILLFLLLVFIITDMLGATDIFPFVHPVN